MNIKNSFLIILALTGYAHATHQFAEVQTVATTPITLGGHQIIDGEVVTAGVRVLAAGQGGAEKIAHVDNGIWVVQAGAWTRPADYACGDEAEGTLLVEQGGQDKNSIWEVATKAPHNIICVDPIA